MPQIGKYTNRGDGMAEKQRVHKVLRQLDVMQANAKDEFMNGTFPNGNGRAMFLRGFNEGVRRAKDVVSYILLDWE